jgi:arginyl-tRNA synthetase
MRPTPIEAPHPALSAVSSSSRPTPTEAPPQAAARRGTRSGKLPTLYFVQSGPALKTLIDTLLRHALSAVPADVVPATLHTAPIEIERTRDSQYGDFASNLAMQLAKATRQNPRKIAQALLAALPADPAIAKVEIAGAGFINFFLKDDAYHAELGKMLAQGETYGRSQFGAGHSVLVEFVSANPTGPLHVAHGRHAAYGASLANLLEAAGYRVTREYYINDAGRQMDILAVSTWLRYLEHCGEQLTFPANAYVGDYIAPIAARLFAAEGVALKHSAAEVFKDLPLDEPQGGDKDIYIDALIDRARALIGDAGFLQVLKFSLDGILADIREDLSEFRVTFDSWFSERSLSDSGAIDRAIETLQQRELAYLKDGALWFKSTAFGDEKDRVMVRENKVKTYFASDIAFILNKRERGFEHLLYVWGADHHGYIVRLRAGLEALGGPPECFEVRLIQVVSLFRGGEKAKMSKRSGDYVTLRELREEVGNDAARLFYVMRSNDQHLDFDLELAKARSNDNPVYYIQYAHARVASVQRQLQERGVAHDAVRGAASHRRLTEPQEVRLIKRLASFPEVIQQSAVQRAPHTLVHYLRDLANDFHTYYSAHQFIVDDESLRDARLNLALATQIVIRNGLGLLGVSAPDTM